MTTKNIQDVVAEKVEKAIIRLAATGCFEGKGDKILQPYADWLTTTLTQLVKEVEAGERERARDVVKDIPLLPVLEQVKGNQMRMDEMLYTQKRLGFIEAKNVILKALTPPTSDEEK